VHFFDGNKIIIFGIPGLIDGRWSPANPHTIYLNSNLGLGNLEMVCEHEKQHMIDYNALGDQGMRANSTEEELRAYNAQNKIFHPYDVCSELIRREEILTMGFAL
jgi:hypothetical protein